MPYKITKYRNKHKIVDTKSGKSIDIDIERYMNGGYSHVNTYSTGGVFPCAPGDIECQKSAYRSLIETGDLEMARNNPFFDERDFTLEGRREKGLGPGNNAPFMFDTNISQVEGMNDSPVITEDSVNKIPSITSKDQTITNTNVQGSTKQANKPTTEEDDGGDENPEVKDKNFNIFNPYAGVDIPSAAFALGQNIQNKNTLGTVGSALKVGTGLARNLFSGLGYQNRYNQVMKDDYEEQKKKKNPVQTISDGGKLETFAYGGKKDEELVTGEYMRGVSNENTEDFNAEIEKGEYFQTNQGDIAEVVGDKHSQGGEKILMEDGDRVLSDKLKIGASQAKELSKKYDLKLKAKNTYSDVLDKYRKKVGLDDIIEQESQLLKKIGEQDKVNDSTTKNFNIEVLSKKIQELKQEKHPLEEERKDMFEDLFNIQESSKKGKEKNSQNFENGGEIVPQYEKGEPECPKGYEKNSEGKCVKKELDKEEAEALDKVPEGQSKDAETNFFGGVNPDSFKDSLERNKWYFDQHPNFDVSDPNQVKDYQTAYNKIAERLGAPTVQVDGKWGEQTDSIDVRKFYKETPYEPNNGKETGQGGLLLFPNESPLPPSALQGTIKPERRFDRVTPTEINPEPYLQDIRDREEAQVQSLEGLSPNVRAAVLANLRANSQKAESDLRNRLDTQNLQSQERAIYTNAQIQSREENAFEQDRLGYEQRQYRAQALTDNDINNYFNQLQALNKQRYMDVHNLNLINATNEDVAYIPGRGYVRKTTNKELFDQFVKNYNER